jgi:7-carboxy-7-deazaguanine synthase
MLKICELFLSIQGKPTYAGCPCIFIRLSGCNLRCSYCDTPYAYEEGEEWEIPHIGKALEQYPFKLVCITGGEPLLQGEVYDLIETLDDRGYKILLETNGSISIKDIPPQVIKIMDIKAPGSKESGKNLYNNISCLGKNDEIKFVLCSREDYLWAKARIEEYRLDRICSVLLSPAWGILNPAELAGWMLEDGTPARLQLQLQKIIFPSKRREV